MIDDATAGAIADHIDQLDARYLQIAAEQLAGTPVTAADLVAMIVLEAHPDGLSQTAWGQQQGVSRQRAHTIAGKLARQGFVQVERAGRASRVGLAPPGARFLEAHRGPIERALASSMTSLDAAEARVLLALLSPLVGPR